MTNLEIVGYVLASVLIGVTVWLAVKSWQRPPPPRREEWATRRCLTCHARNALSSTFPLAEAYRFGCWRCQGNLSELDVPRGHSVGCAVQVQLSAKDCEFVEQPLSLPERLSHMAERVAAMRSKAVSVAEVYLIEDLTTLLHQAAAAINEDAS